MAEKKGTHWTEREDIFLTANYMSKTNEQLTGGLMFQTGIYRSPGAISARIHTLGLKGRPHGGKRSKTQNPRHEKPIIHKIIVPKIKPVIRNPRLFEIFQEEGFNLVDLAHEAGMDIDLLRGFIGQGGLPKEFIKPVERLCGGGM